ncbi:type II toxin-antitoxin system death-on-curing family toxin [Simkania negevensis]|uniref:Type II toxin-antitoxin system death-on-curing family toxin n=1 Tax=Simkania negevensis TaxID=83561 RepID=A0ABS3AQH7_9BACT|nr:type II toxin-antitoxin system death-on-curing family toxin [Simkania negevensis]
MSEPTWVCAKIVYAIHQSQLAEHGGARGIQTNDLLESALSRPKNLYFYSNPKPTLFALAASYAYGIIKNHPFIDGNKRVALVVSQLFLRLNGYCLNISKEEKYLTFIKLASGEVEETALNQWFTNNSSEICME